MTTLPYADNSHKLLQEPGPRKIDPSKPIYKDAESEGAGECNEAVRIAASGKGDNDNEVCEIKKGFTPAQSYPGRPYDYDPLPYPTPPSVGTIHSLPPAPPALDSPGYHSYLHHHSNAPPLVLHHGNPEQQKIKTLFISGLPDDVKAREIHNLFRHHRGFSSCQLKYTGRGNEVVAFAMFINHQSAIAALGALNGTIFDPETRAVIHIELARSNSRKRPRGGAAYWIIDKRTKFHKEATEEWSDEGTLILLSQRARASGLMVKLLGIWKKPLGISHLVLLCSLQILGQLVLKLS
ncbi:hypothetical protein HPP92_004898 [Vanilla planifolia]|uniref:RRM domain-containing protein n=1 Tax=Vanilla planifolia TaxID=51239 RepID=A0A835RR70_VANPL|nr:hypothetical protein HPP92_004898 [Vanilla planifolia]